MHRILLVLGLGGMMLSVFPKVGFSNEPADGSAVPFRLQSSNRTTHNRLIIPQKFLEQAGIRLQENQAANLRTVIAGLAISVSLICLVFLIVRKKSHAAQTGVLLIGVLGIGFLWGEQVAADGPPPASRVSDAWKYFAGEKGQYVIVEITEEGETIQLILDAKFKSDAYRDLQQRKERARMKAQFPEEFKEPPGTRTPSKTEEAPASKETPAD